MSRAGLVALPVVLLALAPAAAIAKAPFKGPAPTPLGDQVVEGQVIVRYAGGVTAAERADARADNGARLVRKMLVRNTELVKVDRADEAAAARALQREADVISAEPNRLVTMAKTPTEPRFGELWGLHNTGATILGHAGIADADIDAPEAWNMSTGTPSTVVAVVDTGVAQRHPELSPVIWVNPGEDGAAPGGGSKRTNGVDDDGNGKIDDWRGWDFVNNDNDAEDDNLHGTHVAGTIAARANNAVGIAGVNWGSTRIMPLKALNAAGSGSFAGVADAFAYAGAKGAKVVNASLGALGVTSPVVDAAIAGAPNTLFVLAAGNDANNNDTVPAGPCVSASAVDQPNKICVAATDLADQLAGFSNFGVTQVDLAAPGVAILSSTPHRTVRSDDFETPLPGRWIVSDAGQSGPPQWARTTELSFSPVNSITDSPGALYANNTNTWARTATALNLTGMSRCQLTFVADLLTEFGFDKLRIETSQTPAVAASWVERASYSGDATGTGTVNLTAVSGLPGVFIRLRFTSDGSAVGDGVHVDDVKVKCFPPTYDASSYDFLQGTSMATPHVAGVAGLVFSRFPGLSVANAKSKLLSSVDVKASLTGKVASKGRLNAYKALAESTVTRAGGILTFTAGAGETNGVSVAPITVGGVPQIRITDNYTTSPALPQGGSRINLGPSTGCTRVNATGIQCPAAGITRVVVNAGDLNDIVTVASAITLPVTLDGGTGDDRLTGGGGGDMLLGRAGIDTLAGAGGNDTFAEEAVSNGADRIDGGLARDTIDYSARTVPVRVSFNGLNDDGADAAGDGVAEEGDRLLAMELIKTGAGPDTIDSLDGDLAAPTADNVTCGNNADTVRADPADVVSPTCESVTRV